MCVQTDSPERNGPTDHRGMLNSVCQFPFPLESCQDCALCAEGGSLREGATGGTGRSHSSLHPNSGLEKQAGSRPPVGCLLLFEGVCDGVYLLTCGLVYEVSNKITEL